MGVNTVGEDTREGSTAQDGLEAKRRRASFRVLLRYHLQMIISLAIIILAGISPTLAGSILSPEKVTLEAGKPGVIPFHVTWPPGNTKQVLTYFTLRFMSVERPFSINGEIDIHGFKNTSQSPRFITSVTKKAWSLAVDLHIDTVDPVDEDLYVFTAIILSHEELPGLEMVIWKDIRVLIAPGPAMCFMSASTHLQYLYEAHCNATTGNTATALACYQNGKQIALKGNVTSEGLLSNGIFLLPDNSKFSCCSYIAYTKTSESVCNDFVWPPVKPRDKVTSPTTPKIQGIETNRTYEPTIFRTKSGMCKLCTTSPPWSLVVACFVTILAVLC